MNSVSDALCFGDRVSVCCERANHFLSSTGVADARLILSEPGAAGSPMLNFERCIFALERPKAASGQPSLQTSWTESSTNAAAVSQDPIMFGNVVQLRHIYSGRFVAVTRTRRAESRGSLYVALEPLSAENALSTQFRVMPRYKIRQEGERINGGDHLVLFNELLRVHLSLDANLTEVIASASMESFSLYVIDGFDTSRHSGCLRLLSSVLLFHKEQESFFQLSPISGESNGAARSSSAVLVHPHIRDSTYNIASLEFSGNSLWVIESVQCTQGGIVSTHEGYRIKHCATGRYLAASLLDGEQLIGVDCPTEGDASVWYFAPCDPTERLIQSGTTFFRIQNARTGSWIHTKSTPPAVMDASPETSGRSSPTTQVAVVERTDPLRGIMSLASHRLSNRSGAAHYTGQLHRQYSRDYQAKINGVVCMVERPAYVDVFCAVAAPYAAERDVHRVLGYRSILVELLLRLESSLSTDRHLRDMFSNDINFAAKVHVCLRDLVPFCFAHTVAVGGNEGGHSSAAPWDDMDGTAGGPEVVVAPGASSSTSFANMFRSTSPNTLHQRMLIDQDVHTIVVNALILFRRVEEWYESPTIVQIVGQLFRFLTAAVADNDVGCAAVYHHLQAFLPYLELLPSACGIFAQVAKCKPLPSPVLHELLHVVVPQLSVSRYNDVYFALLQDVCIAGGKVNVAHQAIVFEALLASRSMPHVSGVNELLSVRCEALRASTRSQSKGTADTGSATSIDLHEDVDGAIPVTSIDDGSSPIARFCAGSWSLLGRCTVGCPYPPLAWIEVDHLVPLLEATAGVPVLQQAVVAVARSVFLADVDAHEPQHPQLWSWKYRLTENDDRPNISQIQMLIMNSTLQTLKRLISTGEGLRNRPSGDLLNELLLFWSSVVTSHCYTEDWAQQLATVIDDFFAAISPHLWSNAVGTTTSSGRTHHPATASSSTAAAGASTAASTSHPVDAWWASNDREHLVQSIFHVLNILQALLQDSASTSAKHIRHLIRPQLHEESSESVDALVHMVRTKSHSALLCRERWLPSLLHFAAFKNPSVALGALQCIFNILSLSRLSMESIEASLVFSDGHERVLGAVLDVAHLAASERFALAAIPRYETLLEQILIIIRRSFASDIALTLDAQNVLHFAGLHSSICAFIEAAQRASVAHLIATTVSVGMELLHFMGNKNEDVARDMVQHLPALCLMSTTCQFSSHYFEVLASTFAAAEQHTCVDVTKLVNDIFQSEAHTEGTLGVVLAALRCPSDKIRSNAREATVGAVSAINFDDGVPQNCKPLLLEILCECASSDTREALTRHITVTEILSICPAVKEFSVSAVSARDVFEVCCRCVMLLYLKSFSNSDVDRQPPTTTDAERSSASDASPSTAPSTVALRKGIFDVALPSLLREEAELIKRRVLDVAVEVSATSLVHTLPASLFECLTCLMSREDFRPLFAPPLRKLASYVLNHCETSVNTKFQLECKDHLLNFFEHIESYIIPESLPNIAVVRRRLQRITVLPDRVSHGASTSTISGNWSRLRRDIGNVLREPSENDLAPLVDMLLEGTLEARRIIEMFVGHLRTSDLPSWVSVSLLLCLRYMLERSEATGEREMVHTQNLLNQCHATPLLSTLLEKPNLDVVRHAVRFGISLLEGGNKLCQDALLNYFKTHDEKFFLTIRKYMKAAQNEINSRSPSEDRERTLPHDSFSVLSKDLCRLMQLLCEGHHFAFQNYVRHQNDNFNSYNMCVLVMELLHTLLLRMDAAIMPIAVQALNTLTEFCQGPCQANQSAIVGCNVVAEVNRVLTMRCETEQYDEDDVMEMKQAAIVLLLSLLEGSQDGAIPNLILTHIDTSALHALVEHVWTDAFVPRHGSKSGAGGVVRREGGDGNAYVPDSTKEGVDELLQLGFNIFILAKILKTQGDKHRSDHLLGVLMDTAGYAYFNESICNIEIWRDDDPESLRLETVYFRKPEICRLREETKESVMNFVDRSSLVSKHSDFCKCADDLIFEMEFQFQIEEAARGLPKWLRIVTFNLATCRPRPVEDVLLLLALTSNLLVVSGYTDRNGPIHWGASVSFFIVGTLQIFCCAYLIVVHLVLSLPRLAHRSLRKGETDPFLSLQTWGEKFRHVTTADRMVHVLLQSYSVAFIVFLIASLLGVLWSPFFYTFLLAMVTFKAPLLTNIVKAITMNGRQLLLTAFLGVISVYFFSVIGYLFFYDHFERGSDEDGGNRGSNCETLLQCFFFSFGQGVRGGGGIGEELKTNHWEDGDFFRRELYDTLFFVIVAVIVMNIVFALIVDTFAELRDARKKVEDDMRTTCFVCGIDAATFDREGEGFGPHTKGPHNVWQYLYFLHHLRRKAATEYTGQESYVAGKVKKLDLSFFPVNRSKSLIKPTNAAGTGNDKSEDKDEDDRGAGGFLPSLPALKKAMRDVVEEQLSKALRTTTVVSAQSTSAVKGNAATAGAGAGAAAVGTGGAATVGSGDAPGRGASLWAKARMQRGSIVRNAVAPQRAATNLVSTPVAARPSQETTTPLPNSSFLNLSFPQESPSLASTMSLPASSRAAAPFPPSLGATAANAASPGFSECLESASDARNMIAAIREMLQHERL